jgi:hypothetical protein
VSEVQVPIEDEEARAGEKQARPWCRGGTIWGAMATETTRHSLGRFPIAVMIAATLLLAAMMMIVLHPSLRGRARRLRAGMTQAEAIRVLGEPTRVENAVQFRPRHCHHLHWVDSNTDLVVVFFADREEEPERCVWVSPGEVKHPSLLWPIRRWLEDHLPIW